MEATMDDASGAERFETVIIGGGQAGLSVGYHLKRRGRPFVILDANERVGDSWRKRWDSLHLFTPARHDGLDGMKFPAKPWSFPSRDAMADYLGAYVARFGLPVRSGTSVDGVRKDGDRYVVTAGERRFEAEHVVVASGVYQVPRLPGFAPDLAPDILQMHSTQYGSPSQLRPGGVLVVGAGNSGSEIALEAVANGHPTWLAGPDPGHIPFRIRGLASRLVLERLVIRFVFHRVLTLGTPMGRRLHAKHASNHTTPLIRIRPKEIVAAGIERVEGRVAGIRDGRPELEDGRLLDVANVIWATGFRRDFSWIDGLGDGEPAHVRGVVDGEPGLYLVGLDFLYAMSSAMVHGVGRDAEHVVKRIVSRVDGTDRARAPRVAVG
jgi:putative flavoprotein involved in K+ transport